MCATKPSASWPHSPSRTSSSACALLGIRSSPRHGLSPVSRSASLACWVIAIGRVCGTAIGTDAHPDDPGHAEAARRPRAPHARTPPSGCRARARAGAGTASRRCRAAAGPPAAARRRPRSGRARTTSAAAGRGSRGTGRRRRWRPPTGAARRSPCVDQVPARRSRPRCRRRGTRRARAPSSASSAPSSSGTSSTMCTRRGSESRGHRSPPGRSARRWPSRLSRSDVSGRVRGDGSRGRTSSIISFAPRRRASVRALMPVSASSEHRRPGRRRPGRVELRRATATGCRSPNAAARYSHAHQAMP